MPASYKAVEAKSHLQRNIFSGLDVEEGPKNYPEKGQEISKNIQIEAINLHVMSTVQKPDFNVSNGAHWWKVMSAAIFIITSLQTVCFICLVKT